MFTQLRNVGLLQIQNESGPQYLPCQSLVRRGCERLVLAPRWVIRLGMQLRDDSVFIDYIVWITYRRVSARQYTKGHLPFLEETLNFYPLTRNPFNRSSQIFAPMIVPARSRNVKT